MFKLPADVKKGSHYVDTSQGPIAHVTIDGVRHTIFLIGHDIAWDTYTFVDGEGKAVARLKRAEYDKLIAGETVTAPSAIRSYRSLLSERLRSHQ